MSALEDALAFQIRACRLPVPEREYRFSPPRRWRFDFAFPAQKLAVEVQGGVWMAKGRHTTGRGATSDAEKLSMAAVQGWRVLVVVEAHITSGEAVRWIQQALEAGC